MKWGILALAIIPLAFVAYGLRTGTMIANNHFQNAQRPQRPFYYWFLLLGNLALAGAIVAYAALNY
jgi:hypothetical protein